jgi:hypothetical protein
MKKYNANKHRAGRGGYVNQSHGITDDARKKHDERKGKLWSQIDFQMLEHQDHSEGYPHGATKIGTLMIGNTEVDLTMAEAHKIAITCFEASEIAKKKYRLNM